MQHPVVGISRHHGAEVSRTTFFSVRRRMSRIVVKEDALSLIISQTG